MNSTSSPVSSSVPPDYLMSVNLQPESHFSRFEIFLSGVIHTALANLLCMADNLFSDKTALHFQAVFDLPLTVDHPVARNLLQSNWIPDASFDSEKLPSEGIAWKL